MYGLALKHLNCAYNFRRFAGLRPAPRLTAGAPAPNPDCASGAKYGLFTVTPARSNGERIEVVVSVCPCPIQWTKV